MVEETNDLTHNQPEYTVSEISQALKRTVEQSYARVRIRGEISGFTRASSGHRYMAMKDENAVIDAICWRGTSLDVEPEDGLEVIVSGRLTTYPGRSKYQVIIEEMEVAGEGTLLKLLEERRQKFIKEGLFDEKRKKELPYLPEVIGVVTSQTGVVISDILQRLRDRFPRHVLLWPVQVQGEGSARQIAAAIEGFNALGHGPIPRPDVLIVARGGGSLEDLWAFNEEVVVRAAAASEIPLISAVGHETDVTLIDFASDSRAPTPTAAAEIAVPVRAELASFFMDYGRRFLSTISRMFDERRMQLVGLGRGLPDLVNLVGTSTQQLDVEVDRLVLAIHGFAQTLSQDVAKLDAGLVDPRRQIANTGKQLAETGRALEFAFQQNVRLHEVWFKGIQTRLGETLLEQAIAARQTHVDDLVPRFDTSIYRILADLGAATRQGASLLESLSFEQVLERGYVVVYDSAGHPISRGGELENDDAVALQFADVNVNANITGDTTTKQTKGSALGNEAKWQGADPQRRLL